MTTRLGRDSGMYAYVGNHLLHGQTPYVTAWEQKPPGIFFVNAVGLWLGKGTRWGIFLMEFVFLLGAAAFGYYALKRSFGLYPAILASLLWLVGLSFVLEGGNLTEEYCLLFSFLSLYLFGFAIQRPDTPWAHALLGVVFGCSFMFRPNNTGVQVSIILTELVLLARKQWPRTAIKGLIATGIGFLLPVLAVSLYFVTRNAFGAFLDAAFLYNFSYGNQPQIVGAFLSGISNLGFAVGVGLVGVWMAVGRMPTQIRNRNIDPFVLWICIDFVVEILFSGVSGLGYPHYFISWLPWVAFAGALLFSQLPAPAAQWFQRFAVLAPLAAIVLLALMFWNTLTVYGKTFAGIATDRSQIQRSEPLPTYVNEHTQPGDTVLVWGGDAGVNFLAGRDAPTAHFQYAILFPSRITDGIGLQFYEDIVSRPPKLILDGSGGDTDGQIVPLSTGNPVGWAAAHQVPVLPYTAEFFAFFHSHYTLKTSVAGVPIYILKP